MRTKFSIAMEGADASDSLSAGAPAIDNNQAGLLEAALEEHADVQASDKSVDELVDGQDKLTEIAEVAQESLDSQGLSPRALSILKMSVKNIVGKNIANRSVPSMESYNSSDAKEITVIALEGITDTIKQFWQAIKNQLGKFWTQTKSWYLKTFDVSNKIISRAKALEEKAGQLSVSANEKSFDFSQANFIKYNNDVKNTANVIKGVKNVRQLLDETLLQLNAVNQNDKSDKVLEVSRRKLEGLRSQATKHANGASTTWYGQQAELVKALTDSIEPETSIIKMASIDITDAEMLTKLGVNGQQNIVVKATDILSGDKRLYRTFDNRYLNINGNNVNIPQFIDSLKAKRFVLTAAFAKERNLDESVSVPTLNASQIGEIASTVGEMGEIVLKYKQAFDLRDKYINKLVKGFDQIIKELDGTEVKHVAPSSGNRDTLQRNQENFRRAQTNAGVTGQQPAPQQPAAPQQAPATESADSNAQPEPADKANDSVDKDIRRLANTMMANFKKSVSISGAVVTHTIKVANAFLSYGEQSLSQYGK